MKALFAFLNFPRLSIIIGVTAVILLFVFTQGSASATVPIPPLSFDLVSGHNSSGGVWGDGTTLWVVKKDQREIITYNPATGLRHNLGEFYLSGDNANVQGIWSDGTVMWVADWDDKILYAYQLDKQSLSNYQRIPARDISLTGSNEGPRGMWGFGTTIFVVDKDDTYVYAYNTTDGSRLNAEEFDLDGDNDDPWGIGGQGTKVWISDIDDEMLYVYERSPSSTEHGDRLPTFEIRLPSDNDDPRGIWSDGETMWVVDEEDSRMYAMHFRDFRHPDDEIDITQVTTSSGLWTDGEIMWVADAGRSDYGKLLAYDLSDGTRRSGKDVQLAATNLEPLSMWSDGTTVWVLEDAGNDFLYAYAMNPEAGDEGLLVPYKSITLHTHNADPVGTWSNGDTIWVSDSGDDKLYAYDLSDKTRKAGRDIDLHSNNDDPGEIWSDGETIWVLDTADKGAYAYRLSNGDRREGREFRTVPDNDDPDGGLTGHGLRIWVADGDDEKLYAYGTLNTPPTFGRASASLKIHRTAEPGDYVGSVPEVIDPDGDTIIYLLSSGGLGVFRLDYQTGEIFLRDDATAFSGGEEYMLTVSVSDSKSALDRLDDDPDDAISVTIKVTQNADPEFTTADDTVFYVAEDAKQGVTIANIDITDLDEDSLFYESYFRPYFQTYGFNGEMKLSRAGTFDYESRTSYAGRMRIRDNKNESGQTDFSWDDVLKFTLQITNVDEDGEIILDSYHPQVGNEIVATLYEPDGVELSNGNQINWVVESSSDAINWTEVSNSNTGSTDHGYTPVAQDAAKYLRFKATYKDGYDTVNARTIEAQTDNKVLAEPPSNGFPAFTESYPSTRTIAENAAGGSNVGSPVSATDPDGDTITYLIAEYYSDKFGIDPATGQIVLDEDESLDYEARRTYYVRVIVRDSKDLFGDADAEYDVSRLVTINVTNVDEDGSVELSTNTPTVDEEITADLGEPDGSISNLTWQWQIADSNPSTTWTDIAGATSDAYAPTPNDIGKYLRAKATYDDWESTGKEAIGTATNAVHRPANELPEFDEGANATRSINENSVAGTRVGPAAAATDPEGDILTYSLASGTDSGKFSIDSASGRLEVASSAVLDYEADSSLEVTLQVSDGKAADHSQDSAVDATITLTINLVNVDEPGEVTFSSREVEVGTSVESALTDPDVVSSADWHWEKSQDGATNWEAISGASSATYTPVPADVGMYLKAMVDYTDGEGSGKSANGMTDDAVKSLPVDPPVDTSLASLRLGGIDFTFSSSTLQYSLTVPNGKKRTKVMPTTTASSGVRVEITPADSKPFKSGHQVALAVGETLIFIAVSENAGSASTTYMVLVTREAPATQDPPQQDPPSEDGVAEDCRSDERDGLIADCLVGRFAVVRVEFDGSYTIDWSEWDSNHPDVTGYDIVQKELLYKMYYEGDRSVPDSEIADVYESCEFSDGGWTCEGRLTSNYFEDWDGNPTEILQHASNEDLTQWSSALDAPGRHYSDETFVRWSGDATDPNNEPTEVTYQVMVFEMDFYYFTLYEGSQTRGREIVVVDGVNGFD